MDCPPFSLKYEVFIAAEVIVPPADSHSWED